MALVGDNGAGKSLINVAGIYSIDSGQVPHGMVLSPVSIGGPKDAVEVGIEVVYQDLALC